MKGESVISLYLLQNNYNGWVKCSKKTSTLVAYKIIRSELDNKSLLNKIPEREYAGVYILFGTDENIENKKTAYIGKGINLLTRIKQSHDSINWSEAIIITTSNNCLDSASISYIENKFINIAVKEQYEQKNKIETGDGNPNEETIVDLEEFIELAKIYVMTLGYPIFEEKYKKNEKKFYFKNANGEFDAEGVYLNNNHFIVFKGSKIRDRKGTDGTAPFVANSREQYKSRLDNYILKEDIEFTSPSLAAAFVYGQNSNGRTSWKLQDGTTLDDYINSLTNSN